MRSQLKIFLAIVICSVSFPPAAFTESSADFTSESCAPPQNQGSESPSFATFLPVEPPGEKLTACAAINNETFRVGVLGDNGECTVQAGTSPVFYRSYNQEELDSLRPVNTDTDRSTQSYREGVSQSSSDYWNQYANNIAADFKSKVVKNNARFCADGTPPINCLPPAITCCDASNPGGGGDNEGDGNGSPGGQDGNSPGGSSGYMRGSSGGDGSGEDGSGEDPLTMGEFELLYIPAQAPTSEDALIIIEVSAKKNATASNPFGICVDARTSPSGNVNRNVNPGALKADGCSEEFDWKNYSEFMGEIAGIAIAAPFAAPWIAPALTIPGVNTVVVGATVVVAGYLLIKWLSEPTPYQLIQQIEVDCDISCGVSSAALSMIAASAISTAGMLYVKVEPKKLINDTLDRLSRQRYIPHRGDLACCETVCRAALLSNPGCYGLCFEQCTFHTQTCWETGWDIIVPGGCGLVGRLAAVACSYAL